MSRRTIGRDNGRSFRAPPNTPKASITAYGAEYATQSDHPNNPGNYDVDHWMLEVGVAAHGFKPIGGVESLAGNGVDHDFDAERGSADLAEWDGEVMAKFGDHRAPASNSSRTRPADSEPPARRHSDCRRR